MAFKKRSILAIAIVAFAATAVLAFNPPTYPQHKAQALQWFEYLGDVNGNGLNDPMDYEEIDSPDEICLGSTDLCAIEAPEDGSTGRPTQAGVDDPNREAFKN